MRSRLRWATPKTIEAKNWKYSVQQAQLILVDGMPGTGKSTLSQFIDHQLRANGQAALWCHEESAVHPVRLFYEQMRHRSWTDYCDDVESCWRRYVHESSREDRIAIFDAALFQNHVRSMLIFNCNRNLILDLVLRIENVIAALNPVLIYLRPRDVEANFHDVVQVRGPRLLELWIGAHDQYPYTRAATSKGYAGFIAFWREFAAISDSVFDRLSIKKLTQDVSHRDWGTRYAEVLDFLNISQSRDTVRSDRWERFVGEYESLTDLPVTNFQIRAKGECLEVTVHQPTFDIQSGPFSCFRQTRLFLKSRNRFYVAGWPHEVHFAQDGTGAIEKLSVSNSTAGWPQMRIAYRKIS